MRQSVFNSSQANFGWSRMFWRLQNSIQTEASHSQAKPKSWRSLPATRCD